MGRKMRRSRRHYRIHYWRGGSVTGIFNVRAVDEYEALKRLIKHAGFVTVLLMYEILDDSKLRGACNHDHHSRY